MSKNIDVVGHSDQVGQRAKSELILDGFIREIGRRQKSFDVRHKFFWYQPSKINRL